MTTKLKTRQLSTRVEDDLAAAVEAPAEQDRRTVSDWMRCALAVRIEQQTDGSEEAIQ